MCQSPVGATNRVPFSISCGGDLHARAHIAFNYKQLYGVHFHQHWQFATTTRNAIAAQMFHLIYRYPKQTQFARRAELGANPGASGSKLCSVRGPGAHTSTLFSECSRTSVYNVVDGFRTRTLEVRSPGLHLSHHVCWRSHTFCSCILFSACDLLFRLCVMLGNGGLCATNRIK